MEQIQENKGICKEREREHMQRSQHESVQKRVEGLENMRKQVKRSYDTRAELQQVQSENNQVGMCDEESINDDAISNCDQYLREGGWQNVNRPFHEQEFVQNEMHSFYLDQEDLEHRQCTICKEA